MGWVFLMTSLVIAVAGQILTKWGIDCSGVMALGKASLLNQVRVFITTPAIVVGGALYALSFFFYLNALTLLDLSKASPGLSLSYVLVVLSGQFLFHEQVTPIRWIGVILIVVGVFFISRS